MPEGRDLAALRIFTNGGNMKQNGRILLVAVALLAAATGLSRACTGIRLVPADGAEIIGRTMEFGVDMQSDVIVVPRGISCTGSALNDAAGHKWTTKFAALGMNGVKLPVIVDGLNEKGLSVGAFYFPDFAKYQDAKAGDAAKTLAPWELPTYLLTTTGTVAEAVKAAKEIVVAPVVLKAWKFCPPVHYRLQDASGKAAVLEYVDGVLKIHDNPLGVVTNSPTFDWHMVNMRNYLNLSATGAPTLDLDKIKLSPLGQGNGMIGLPGDFTPPSRFVRAVAFTQTAIREAKAEDAVKQAFHILNNFDIPKGAARGHGAERDSVDYTQWTAVSDLTNKKFFFNTYENNRIRVVDLNRCDLDAKSVTLIPIRGESGFEDVTTKTK